MIWSQPSKIDSLEQLLDTAIHDTTRLDVLDQLFSHYIYNDLEKSLSFANQLLATAEKTESQKYICTAYISLGHAYLKMNLELDSVLHYYDKAFSYSEAINDLEKQGKVLNRIGGAYHRYGFHVEAVSYYQQALTIAENRNDTLSMIPCLANMASVMKERLDYEKSLKYSRQALSYARAIDHQRFISMIINNIANLYFNQQVYDTALVLYEEALEYTKKSGSELSLVITLANIGGVHAEEQRYERAQSYLDEAYTMATQLDYPYGKGLCLRYMSASALAQKKYDSAIQLSYDGLSSLNQKIAIRYSRDFHAVLSESYEKLNVPDSALAHLKIYNILNCTVIASC